MPKTRSPLLKNLLSLMPLGLLGRAGTLLIYALLAKWFGATEGTDFIYYYWSIATFLIELLSAASAYSVLVPLLAEARSENEEAARRCVQAVFSLYLIVMPGVSCLFIGIAWGVSQWFFPNTGLSLSAEIGIVAGFACFVGITTIRWILKAILDTYQVFHLPAVTQGVRALIVIATIYIGKPYLSLLSIPLALIFGELFQAFILFRRCCAILNLQARHLLYPAQLRWKTPHTQQFLRQCLLMMGAAVSDGLNPVVDRGMGSSLGASSVSKLDYALRLCAIPETLTGVTLPVLLSHWAKLAAGKRTDKKGDEREEIHHCSSGSPEPETGQTNKPNRVLQQSVWRGVVAIVVLMGPFLVGFYVFRGPIVNLLYGHGELSEAGLRHIASLLGIYLIGMLPRLMSRLLIRAHLARQNHAVVLSATLIRLVLNPLLNWIFMQFWGLSGIPWSTALLSYPICAFIAIAFFRGSRP